MLPNEALQVRGSPDLPLATLASQSTAASADIVARGALLHPSPATPAVASRAPVSSARRPVPPFPATAVAAAATADNLGSSPELGDVASHAVAGTLFASNASSTMMQAAHQHHDGDDDVDMGAVASARRSTRRSGQSIKLVSVTPISSTPMPSKSGAAFKPCALQE